MIPSYSLAQVFGISISEQRKIYFNHRNTLISLLSNTLSVRYSSLALSEVSPSPLSHDTVSRWLKSRCFRPKDLWRLVEPSIDKKSPCVLIADDTLIAKTRKACCLIVK
ncbi:hypothetical protein [Arsenophonus sp. ENCA]|uniref:hypothetical protein n=1 Tax=Arsenophonus sp. ENCA TaxID=1987579 RepID=UPI0025C71268|nr:hypothetical protein [Arsenophonus sp. ENCA]